MNKNFKGSLILLTAALIWGTAFVAQSEGAQIVEPFTYNTFRMLIGAVVLIPVWCLFRVRGGAAKRGAEGSFRYSAWGGVCCGAVLFSASSLQQIAMKTTSVANAGFVTALYIVIVPLIKLVFFRQKTTAKIWFCVLLAVIGFYLLCIKDGFYIASGDLLVLASAVMFALHIMTIDYFVSKNTDALLMACVQFFTAAFISFFMMLIFEHPQPASIWEAKIAILYAGLLSSGVAYTLQMIGQKFTEPTLATLIMSLESVFAAVSGWLILNQSLSVKELIGCVLVFAAVLLAQVKLPSSKTHPTQDGCPR